MTPNQEPQKEPVGVKIPLEKPDRLTQLNTIITVLAGICTLVIGVWVKANEAQLKEIEKTTKKIETREKVEEASYKFAREFLTQIKGNFTDNTRGTQFAETAVPMHSRVSRSHPQRLYEFGVLLGWRHSYVSVRKTE